MYIRPFAVEAAAAAAAVAAAVVTLAPIVAFSHLLSLRQVIVAALLFQRYWKSGNLVTKAKKKTMKKKGPLVQNSHR